MTFWSENWETKYIHAMRLASLPGKGSKGSYSEGSGYQVLAPAGRCMQEDSRVNICPYSATSIPVYALPKLIGSGIYLSLLC